MKTLSFVCAIGSLAVALLSFSIAQFFLGGICSLLFVVYAIAFVKHTKKF